MVLDGTVPTDEVYHWLDANYATMLSKTKNKNPPAHEKARLEGKVYAVFLIKIIVESLVSGMHDPILYAHIILLNLFL